MSSSSPSPVRSFRASGILAALGSAIPHASAVDVVAFMPRRRVVVRYAGRLYVTLTVYLAPFP